MTESTPTLTDEPDRSPAPFTPDEQAEFDLWDKLGDETWALIDWGEGDIARDSG